MRDNRDPGRNGCRGPGLRDDATMGIDAQLAAQLVKARGLVAGKETALMLGRQKFHIKGKYRRYVRRTLMAEGLDPDIPDYEQPDGFAETFLRMIGYPAALSLDASPYEDCDLTHDMNEPVPGALRDRFDVIIDGGTLEHVFNTPQALDNVFHMLRPGGIFISINGITGWAGHGFYQFSPELVWRYWKDARRCILHDCAAVPHDVTAARPRPAPDTGAKGRRFRGAGMEGRWYLFYIVERVPDAVADERITNVAQGDYSVRWQGPAAERAGQETGVVE